MAQRDVREMEKRRGKVLEGLTKRRQWEKALLLTA